MSELLLELFNLEIDFVCRNNVISIIDWEIEIWESELNGFVYVNNDLIAIENVIEIII